MRYSKLVWNHSSPTEPVEIYSEHDDQGREQRKVEVFPDGSVGFAGPAESGGGTQLSLIACPPDDEVNSPPEFLVSDITNADFERVWQSARRLRQVS